MSPSPLYNVAGIAFKRSVGLIAEQYVLGFSISNSLQHYTGGVMGVNLITIHWARAHPDKIVSTILAKLSIYAVKSCLTNIAGDGKMLIHLILSTLSVHQI